MKILWLLTPLLGARLNTLVLCFNFIFSLALVLLLTSCRGSDAPKNSLALPSVANTPQESSNFASTKNLPPRHKILLFIGQDSETITDYITSVPEDNIEGVTLYTQIKSAIPNNTLNAIFTPDNWQSGIMDFTKTLNESPSATLAVGLAFDNCNQANHESAIAKGQYDESIALMVEHFKSMTPRKVFLRIGYEFDGPWNCYTPENYKKAFQQIAQAINEKNADNIATVWQSATWPDSDGNPIYDFNNEQHLSDWYPGDDVVDWVGISVFYRNLSLWNYQPPTTPANAQQKALNFARAHNKPVMIAEAAPQGYRIAGLTRSVIQENQPSFVTSEEIWQGWYQPFFQFIEQNKDIIRAVAYINTYWENQAMWVCSPNIPAGQLGCNNGNWGDSRVQANDIIKQKWLQKVNNTKLFMQTAVYE